MAVLPADHVIPEEKKFQQVLADSFAIASQGSVIVTIGIKPTGPETGYGYIRHELEALPNPSGTKAFKTQFFNAEQFVEKPPLEKAIEYVNSGKYRWNAGMFIWSFATVTSGLESHEPEMYSACQRWLKAASKGKLNAVLKKEYPTIRKISIDFALMEKAKNVVVADGAFEWDDLGAWPALARHVKQDAEGNAAVGDFVHVDASNNIVFDGRTKGRRTPICLVGLQDTVVVQTDDATMIVNKAKSQKVKDLVRKLAEQSAYKHLV
jgi:mannose-1-phosphate guanylyltransferase